MNAEDILPLLDGVKRSPNGWIARCPSHDDRSPSLSVCEKDGLLLMHCFAGCSYQAVAAALGISTDNRNGYSRNGDKPEITNEKTVREAPPTAKKIIGKSLAAVYEYKDETGTVVFQIVRSAIEYSDGTTAKTFRARRRPVNGEESSWDGWVYKVSGTSLCLYNRPAIADAELVYIVEGEKDVDTLSRLGLAATCNPFGAGKWRREYSESLRDKVAVILPDNDDPGRAHSLQVANYLNGVAKEILIVELPGLAEKEDVTDFVNGAGTVHEIMDLVARTEAWVPAKHAADPVAASKFVFTLLDKLLFETPEDVAFVWAETLPSGGFSICSAKPKVGKSTLARNLAVAIATGMPFLGRPTVQGKVLYLCLEEKRSEIRKHFEKIGVDSDQILIYTGSTPKDALNELNLAVMEASPLLVIIDPLSRVIRVADFNDYGGMSRGLEPLIDLARKTGCHILALHHDSKMDRSGGDALLGSTALFGAVDCHIQMRKRDSGRTIMTTQRYGEDMPETVVELDKETGIIAGVGDLQSFTQQTVMTKIMAAVNAGDSTSESEIKDRVDGYSKGLISKALRSLVDEGKLERTGEGVRGNPYIYALPATYLN